MNSRTALAISSALWLTMLPTASFAQSSSLLPDISASEQAQIFLNAGNLTGIHAGAVGSYVADFGALGKLSLEVAP